MEQLTEHILDKLLVGQEKMVLKLKLRWKPTENK
jgi:hypothetical protein